MVHHPICHVMKSCSTFILDPWSLSPSESLPPFELLTTSSNFPLNCFTSISSSWFFLVFPFSSVISFYSFCFKSFRLHNTILIFLSFIFVVYFCVSKYNICLLKQSLQYSQSALCLLSQSNLSLQESPDGFKVHFHPVACFIRSNQFYCR